MIRETLTLTLGELADQLGATAVGDRRMEISGLGTLRGAKPGELSFLSNPKYKGELAHTKASAVIVSVENQVEGMAHLVAADPYLTFSRALRLFYPTYHPRKGVSEQAVIDETATIEDGATIMPGAIIEPGARVGEGSVIYPGAYVGAGVVIGEGCILYPNVTVREGCVLGDRVIVQAGAVIGSDGFGYAKGPRGMEKIPQVGIVVLEDDVEIGANTTIDRAAVEKTIIGRGTKVDNLVQIGHNVEMGQHCIIISQVGISGSTKVGSGVIIAGQSGVAGHITIGDGAVIGGQTAVTRSVEPGAVMSGPALMPHKQWLRASLLITKLPDMNSRLRRMEKRLEELEQALAREGQHLTED